jgi:uncharacterized protein YjbJ (UPF0337 family)
MDKDRVEGAAHQAKGAVKETAGRMMGDKKTEAEGKGERAAGTDALNDREDRPMGRRVPAAPLLRRRASGCGGERLASWYRLRTFTALLRNM